MNIKIENDGKGKHQSFEASITIDGYDPTSGFYNANFTGYGPDEETAKESLIAHADALIQQINDLKRSA